MADGGQVLSLDLQSLTVEQGVDMCADGAGTLVEGDTYKTVLQSLDIVRQTDGVGGAVVYILAVG